MGQESEVGCLNSDQGSGQRGPRKNIAKEVPPKAVKGETGLSKTTLMMWLELSAGRSKATAFVIQCLAFALLSRFAAC
jgi:hypothetical protein